MKLLRQSLALCAFIGAMGFMPAVLAADIAIPETAPEIVVPKADVPETQEQAATDAPKDLLALKGDARCTACHDEADSPELLAIGKTRHGTVADSRTPTCTSCHGNSEAHC